MKLKFIKILQTVTSLVFFTSLPPQIRELKVNCPQCAVRIAKYYVTFYFHNHLMQVVWTIGFLWLFHVCSVIQMFANKCAVFQGCSLLCLWFLLDRHMIAIVYKYCKRKSQVVLVKPLLLAFGRISCNQKLSFYNTFSITIYSLMVLTSYCLCYPV